MDIHVDIRRFLEIAVWTRYGLSDQGGLCRETVPRLSEKTC